MLNGHALETPRDRYEEACAAYRRAIFGFQSGQTTDEIHRTAREVEHARNQLYAAIG